MSELTEKDLLQQQYDYSKTEWRDKVDDPEGDITHPGTKFTAARANNMEDGIDRAHLRLNSTAQFIDTMAKQQKNLRLEFLLLKSSVTSGLTSNIFVDNFETADDIVIARGFHDSEEQMLYIK